MPKILKNPAIEKGITGGAHGNGNILFLINSKILGVQKEKLLPYPKPLTKLLAISASLAESEKIDTKFMFINKNPNTN